jgi:PEGA domain
MSSVRSGFLCIALWLCFATIAAGQPMGEVVVVPFGTPELSASLAATAALEAELSEARVSLIPLHDARDRFTARSRPPQTASDTDLDALARAAHDAVEHVAFGRTAAAQKSVREVITRAELTLESLNRETTTARHILDACLSLVRSALQTGKRGLALEQATRCRRLVPDLMPSEDAHPADVVGVLMEADNLLRRMRIGHLTVTSAPETGCSVYLNGRHLGTTPFVLERAAAGDYRVQVECNRTLARVHLLQLGDQPASLLVDTQFDRAVASDPRLLLRYEDQRDAQEQAVSHAAQLGREIGATDIVLVNVRDGQAELLRVHVKQQRLIARAAIPWVEGHRFPRAKVEQAIAILAEARLEGEPSLKQNTEEVPERETEPPTPVTEPVVVVDAPAPPDASADVSHGNGKLLQETSERSTWRLWSGGALAVAGAAAAVAGGVLLRARIRDGQRLAAEPQSVALRREWEDDRRGPRLASGIGSALLASGFALAGSTLDLKRYFPLPIATAVLGGTLLAVGATVYAGNDECAPDTYPSPRCISGEHRADRGYQVLVAAAPFLSFSALQLIRWSMPRSGLTVSAGPNRFVATASF